MIVECAVAVFPEHVERSFLDPEYSFAEYFQLGSRRNIRPIKNGLKKGEPKWGIEPTSPAYQPKALPLGQAGSQNTSLHFGACLSYVMELARVLLLFQRARYHLKAFFS